MVDSMLNKKLEGALVNSIYTPAEVSAYTSEHVASLEKRKERAVEFPIKLIGKDYFAPVLAGQLVAIIAQTSQYKSGFMHFWERTLANQLMADGRDDEVIVHVSVEEVVEEQGMLYLSIESGESVDDLARGNIQDWGKLRQAAIRVGTIPIYRIGDSIARAEDYPELYLSNLIKAIQYLESKSKESNKRLFSDRQLKISAIFVDYLQALPFDPQHRTPGNDQRRLQVRDDIYRLRQASALFDCPVIVNVQAKQELGHAAENWRMPGVFDGEETSSIGQRADRIIQLWMPKMTHSIGSNIKHAGHEFRVDENLIFLKVGKQRGRLPSGRTWKCRVDFDKNTIAPETNFE